MLASLIIVFREVLEAGLVIGLVLAATRGISGRGYYVALGVAAGIAGSMLLATFAGEISGLFEGSGQELLNAAILSVAVVMLAWHSAWMASHGREMAAELTGVGKDVAAGRKPLTALAVVVGVAVLREGFEVVLFLYGILASGGESGMSVFAGGFLGILAGGVVAAAIYLGLAAIPLRHLFSVTGILITLLAAGLGADAVAMLQQGGYVDILYVTAWDTSWLLDQGSILGRVLHTLLGYVDQPSELQVLVYILTILAIQGLTVAARPAAATSKAKT